MRKSMIWICLILSLLVVASLACNFGAEEPTATPVPPTNTPVPATDTPEPEPTPEPTPTEEPEPTQAPAPTEESKPVAPAVNMVQAESSVHGVRLSRPENWFFDDTFFIVLTSDPDADPFGDDESLPEGIIMLVMAGPADELELEGVEPDEMFDEIITEFGGAAEAEIVAGPTEVSINGVPVQMVEFRATEEGQLVRGRIAVYNNGAQAAVAIAISPDDLWDEHSDTVDSILESIELFQGSGFGDLVTTPAQEGEWRGFLNYGDLVEDQFAGGDAHEWTFDGRVGEYVTLVLTPLEEVVDVTLELVAPDGAQLTDLDDAFGGEAEILQNYQLAADGEYTIRVIEFFDEPGGYQLELLGGDEPIGVIVPLDALEMGEIAIDESVAGLLLEAQSHAWTLLAQGGEVVNIIVTPLDEGLDLALSVLEPDGNLYPFDNAVSDQVEEVYGWLLELPGEYTIVVEEYYDLSGSYTLAVDYGEAVDDENLYADMGEIAYGEVVNGALPAEQNTVHLWAFAGAAGDVVSVLATPLTDGADLMLGLRGPEGNVLVQLVDNTGTDEAEEIFAYELSTTGTFEIAVTEYWDAFADYELTLTLP